MMTFLMLCLLASGGADLEEILRETGVSSGLCVVVGEQDGWAAALGRSGRFIVHVLEPDAGRAARLSEEILAERLAGQVTVEHRVGQGSLPHTDGLVNLLIVGSSGSVDDKEILRVLAPGGAAWVAGRGASVSTGKAGPSGKVIRRRPRPSVGEWSHPRRGADQNAVSDDREVAIPQGIQWLSGESNPGSIFLSAGGRNYYGNGTCRDAYNGLLLWKAAVKPMVALEDRLIALSGGALVEVDAATGRVTRRFEAAGNADVALHWGNLLLAVGRTGIRAVALADGRLGWSVDASEPRAPVLAGDRLIFVSGQRRRGEPLSLVCLEAASGKPIWSVEAPPVSTLELSLTCGSGILVLESSTLTDDGKGCAVYALNVADGQRRWERRFVPSMTHRKQARALLAQGLVWLGTKEGLLGLDPVTGREVRRFPGSAFGSGHCFPPVATGEYYIHGECDFTDLRRGQRYYSRIQKGACSLGFVPANGLLYTFPSVCICFPMLRGTNALAPSEPATLEVSRFPGSQSAPLALPLKLGEYRLERSSGYSASPSLAGAQGKFVLAASNPAEDWPAYRRDPWRSGSSPSAVSGPLEMLWATSVADWSSPWANEWKSNPVASGPVTAPVVARGLVVVAARDAHQVVALEAATGRVRWSFQANGRIDTPPTLYEDRCLFGCSSGWVYNLSLATGELIWRFRAAPRDERIVAYGQVESKWPVPGSVLIVGKTAYFGAGRHPHADGGIFVYALDPLSGSLKWTRQIQELGISRWYARQGNGYEPFDLMVQDGDRVALSRWQLDPRTGALSLDPKLSHYRARSVQAWIPRGFWSYGPPFHRSRERKIVRKPLLAFDDERLYAALGDTVFARPMDVSSNPPKPEDLGTEEGEADRAPRGRERDEAASGSLWSVNLGAVAAVAKADASLVVAGEQGQVWLLAASSGKTLSVANLSAPAVWDGLAIAGGRVFVSTRDGKVVCLGKR
ncbi:MAG: PQQ-binding-like beta-propeller repeat protein [Planctomycetota bacterium]